MTWRGPAPIRRQLRAALKFRRATLYGPRFDLRHGKTIIFCLSAGPPGSSTELFGDDRETYLSTEPPRAQAPPRLSQAHVDRRRSKGSRAPPRQGPQASFGLVSSAQPGRSASATPGTLKALRPRRLYLPEDGRHFSSDHSQSSRRIPRRSRRGTCIRALMPD